ncbi:hypothetical protein LTS10_011304 [Elasticomyces elasticus]|nr:hypothetical protein LTS10_011304 [Elasticomyces elasticus]
MAENMAKQCEHHRALAVKLGLEEIDRHLGEFDEPEKVRVFLERLIAMHDLKDKPGSGNTHASRDAVPLTTERFEKILETTRKNYPSHSKSGSVISLGSENALREESMTSPNSPVTPIEVPDDDYVDGPGGKPRTQKRAKVAHGISAAESIVENSNARSFPPAPAVPGAPELESLAAFAKHQYPLEYPHENNVEEGPEKPNVFVERLQTTAATPDEVSREVPATTLEKREKGVSTTAISPVNALAKHLVKIGPQSIRADMTAIWVSVQNTARNMFDGVSEGRAVWVSEPSAELLALYQHLFTAKFKSRINEVSAEKPLTRKDALEACLAAALHEYVFLKDVPWDGPKELLLRMKDDVGILDEILQATGCKRKFEQMWWQTASAKLDRDDFRDSKLPQIANGIADDILLVLDPQLHALKARARCRTDHIANLVSEALLLKAKLRAAPDYYEFKWAVSGTALRRASMEEVNPSQGKQEVLWAVSPLVRIKATKDEAWNVAVPAKVFTRPWPEHKG